MADKLDLVGVIGTWVAVSLALIALLGVIPVYILYRQSNTNRHIALDAVDDKKNEYIAQGYKLLPGKRFFRSTTVPDLTNPPMLNTTNFRPGGSAGMKIERKCKKWAKKGYSSTGWLNFANILQAYRIRPSLTGKLVISGKESQLPIHRGWLLLIGLIDRYSRYDDLGLFVDENLEFDWDAFGIRAIWGMSGILDRTHPFHNTVHFQMHDTLHMERMPDYIPKNDLRPQTLFFLYLGYLPANGCLYRSELRNLENDQTDHDETDHDETDHDETYLDEAWRAKHSVPKRDIFWEYSFKKVNGKRQIPAHHLRLARDVGIELERQNIFSLKLERKARPYEKKYGMEESLSTPQYMVSLRLRDKQSMVLALLELNFTPQSFLCEYNLSLFFKRILLNHLDINILSSTLETIGDLQLTESQSLKDKIKKVKENMEGLEERSRTAMQSLYDLDEALKCLGDKEKPTMPEMQAMGILYLTEEEFERQLVWNSRYAGGPESDFIIKPFKNLVRTPGRSRMTDFELNFELEFNALFDAKRYKYQGGRGIQDAEIRLPRPKVHLACLHAYIKWHMWHWAYPSKYLSRFYTRLDPVVYLSAQEMPNETTQDEILGGIRHLFYHAARPEPSQRKRHRVSELSSS